MTASTELEYFSLPERLETLRKRKGEEEKRIETVFKATARIE